MNDAAVLQLASRQHGAVAVRQAVSLGWNRSAIEHRIAQGRWERITSRVLRLVGSAETPEQRLMIAALHHGPDALLARETALAVWGVPGFYDETIEVITARLRNARRTPIAVVHTTRYLPLSHVAFVNGLPITTPIRAIFDIAATEHPKRVERALDNAWARRLIDYALLHRTLDELGRKGRPGITLLRELAEARPRDHRPPESNTEARLVDLVEQRSGIRLVTQRDVGDGVNWVGRVDLGHPTLRNFLVEVQSELFHGSVLDRARDAQRLARLRASGYVVVEVWESEVWRRPDDAVDLVLAGMAEAEQRCSA